VNATERRKLMKAEIAQGIGAMGKDGKLSPERAEQLVGGALGGVIEASGDNKTGDNAFSLQVWRTNGHAMWTKMEQASANAKGMLGANGASGAGGANIVAMAVQPIAGVGDKATILSAGHSVMVLKGDQFFLLGFSQFVPGRDKTTALAKAVVGKL
jgi:hypothetical protein